MAYTKKSSKTTRELLNTYKGFPIFREVTEYYKYVGNDLYDKTRITHVSSYIGCAVKGGNINKSSDVYDNYHKSQEGIKKLIDRIIGGEIVLTEKEFHDWVVKPNAKNGWGFSKRTLSALVQAYKKADARRRLGYLERLTDANFHSERDALESGDYDLCMKVFLNVMNGLCDVNK